jgi:Mn-dependent DtxR family transcriptional regulator
MAQDLLTKLLGVHRDAVAEAADELQHAGLIPYRRGHIDVLTGWA